MTFYKDRFGNWHKENDFYAMARLFAPVYDDDALHDFLTCTGAILDERYANQVSVRDFVQMGMTVEAVKLYRDLTGCSVMEARDAVDCMKMEE